MRSDANDALAALRQKALERDDESDPGGRIYRDKITGEIYHSVTRILSATAPESQQKALESWLKSPGAAETSRMASTRGTLAHDSCEYLLKVGSRLARSAANKRGVFKMGEDGLYRCPSKVTKWGLEKALAGAPPVPWSAAGYARGLRGWILDNVTAVHSVEFYGRHPCGAAGACDALLDLNGEGPILVDWKTTGKSVHKNMDAVLEGYSHQLGAYSLMVRHLTGIQCVGGAVVVARRTGDPSVHQLPPDALRQAEEAFLERCERYFDALHERLSA